jgi:hypothetical protein
MGHEGGIGRVRSRNGGDSGDAATRVLGVVGKQVWKWPRGDFRAARRGVACRS